jgi:hypothetical protein
MPVRFLEATMTDLVFTLASLVCFGLAWAYVRGCGRL